MEQAFIEEKIKEHQAQAPATGFHVLWVDDHPENNVGISQSLAERGIVVTTALSTEDALDKISRQKFQVVVSDLGRGNLPEAGLDMLQVFRQRGISIPTGIYAIHTDKYQEQLLAAGAAVATNDGPEIEKWILIIFEQWAAEQAVAAEPLRPGLQVLWIDDEPENNTRFQEELNELMHAIFTNTVGTAAALEYLARSYFDVIISDISRHGNQQEGRQMLQAFQERNVAVPVVFYTTPQMADQYGAELRQLGAGAVFSAKQDVRKFLGEQMMEKQQRNAPAANAAPEPTGSSSNQPPSAKNASDPRLEVAKKAEDAGAAAMETQNYTAAKTAYEQALELFTELNDNAGRANTHQALGKIAVAVNELEAALKHFQTASTLYVMLDFQPAYAYALMDMGSVQQKLQRLEAAQKSYAEALEILEELGDAENIKDVNLSLENINKNKQSTSAANKLHSQKVQDQTSSLDPTNAEFYQKRGLAKLELQQYESAIQEYDKAISLDPSNADFYHNRGFANAALEHYESAIKDFNQALLIKPNNSYLYLNRGHVRQTLNLFEEALSDYKQALLVEPANSEAKHALKSLEQILKSNLNSQPKIKRKK